MALWKDSRKQLPQPTPEPVSALYICNNDLDCKYSLTGEMANKLAYGCFWCSPPTRFGDLPKETQDLIPTDNIAMLWSKAVPCPFHSVRHIRPFCPGCSWIIDKEGNTPPVGIWGFARAGKTIYCAALMMELEEKLFALTGMPKDCLFNRGQYEIDVVEPLRNRGIVPDRTKPGEHRSLSLRLYRDGWFRKKVTLNDMGGENFKQWFDRRPDVLEKRMMLDHMFLVREAILLMSPESAKGIGATVPYDPLLIVESVMRVLDQQGFLALMTCPQMEALLEGIKTILSRFQHLFGGGGNSLRVVAEEIAGLIGQGDNEPLIKTLDDEMMKTDQQLKPIPLNNQLDGLIGFLDQWGSRGADNKFDLRLAITISKADLLQEVFQRADALARQSANQHGVQDWRAAVGGMVGLNKSGTKRDWHESICLMSKAAKQVLLDFGEEQFVQRGEENFREVGFFFVSSLGRDTEPFLECKVETSAQPLRSATTAAWDADDEVVMPSISRTQQQLQWRLGKLVRIGKDGQTLGTRRPEPQGVLWPLLWILTAH